MSNPNSSLRQRLSGVLPPITMPFDDAGELVKGGLREQIDFIVKNGASGVVAGGSTGEGHTLTDAEFASVMREAYDATAERVPFLAGLIVQSTRAAIERAKMLKGMQVAALQVTPVHYLFKPDAEATIEHFRTIADATGIPILIYNVIPWNYLSVDLMLRIMDEVPGVIGMKQSGGDLKSISDLLLRCKPENIVLSGVDALLYPGFCMGMPFPQGLARLEVFHKPSVRWAWSLNAASSVLGSAAAIFFAIYLGLRETLLLGGALYIGALIIIKNTSHHRSQNVS